MSDPPSAKARGQYEERFRRAGLPLFIVDRDASRDIWTRSVGLLAVVFWVELLGVLDLTWAWWANAFALLAGVGVLAGSWAEANSMRGRPYFARPDDIGPLELAGFAVIPALLPLVVNQQPVSALFTLLGNLALLALIYAVTSLGLVSIVRWAGRRLFSQLATSLLLVAKALPLLMLFSVVLFMTTEIWQVFANMNRGNLYAIALLLVAVGSLFLIVRLPREVEQLEEDVGAGPPLSSRQRINVGLVLFVSQSLQVLLVTAAVGAFFIAFGMIAIDPEVAKTWTGEAASGLQTWRILGVDFTISNQLFSVAAAIAAFSGLYYAIAVFTDSTYREEFLGEVTGEMRETFSERAVYLASFESVEPV